MKRKIGIILLTAVMALAGTILILQKENGLFDSKPAVSGIVRTIDGRPTAADIELYTVSSEGAESVYNSGTWTSDKVVVREAAAELSDIRLQYLTNFSLEWADFGDGLEFQESGTHWLILRYARNDALEAADVSEPSGTVFIFIDRETEFEIETAVEEFSQYIRVYPVNSVSPVTYTYTVNGGASYEDVPGSMIINAGWNASVTVKAEKETGHFATADAFTGPDPALVGATSVKADISGNISGWTNADIIFTLGLEGAAAPYDGTGTFQYKLNDGAWKDISGNVFTVSDTTAFGTGHGDDYRFRFVKGGYITPQTIPYLTRVDKSAAGPQISINSGDYAGGSVSSFPLKITLINMPACGVRSVSVTGGGVLGAVNGLLTVTDPAVSNYTAMLLPIGGSKSGVVYTVRVTDNLGRVSNTLTITIIPPGNNSTDGELLTISGNPTSWVSSATLTVGAGKGVVPNTVMFSKNGSSWESLGLSGTSNVNSVSFSIGRSADKIKENGTYYFYGERNNGATYFGGPVKITYLDSTKPELSVSNYAEGQWVGKDHQLRFLRNPGPSGAVRVEITKNGAAVTPATGPFYYVAESGSYGFTLINGVGLRSDTVTMNVLVDETEELELNVVRNDVARAGVPDAAKWNNGWLDGYVTFTLSATPDPYSGVPVEFYYSVGGGQWKPVGGSVLTVSGNTSADYYFKAVTAGGVESAQSGPYTVKIDDLSVPIEMTVEQTWYSPNGIDASVRFLIYSLNIKCPYTVWYRHATFGAGGLNWENEIQITPRPSDGIYWYKAFAAEDMYDAYRFYIKTESGRISEPQEFILHTDTSFPRIVIENVVSVPGTPVNGWVSRMEITLSNSNPGPSGTVFQYSLNYGAPDEQWHAMDGNVLVLGVGGVAEFFSGNINFRARRGFTGGADENSLWTSGDLYHQVKVDGLASASAADPGSGWTSQSIPFAFSAKNGGSGFRRLYIVMVVGSSEVMFRDYINVPSSITELNDTLTIASGGLYRVYIENMAGAVNTVEFTVGRIDTVRPTFEVTPTGLTAGVQNGSVLFSVTPTAVPLSHTASNAGAPQAVPTKYQYTYDFGATWHDLEYRPVDGNYFLLVDENCDRYYGFRAVSGSGLEVYTDLAAYHVQIRKTANVWTLDYSYDPAWTYENVRITLSVQGYTGLIKYFRLNGSVEEELSSPYFYAPSNIDYQFFAKNENGEVITAVVTVAIRNIDTAVPEFRVNSLQNISGAGWNGGPVTFSFELLPSSVPSGISYYRSVLVGDTWVEDATPLSGSSYQAFVGGTYRFRAVTGAKRSFTSPEYFIQIDEATPTLIITDTTAYTPSGYAQTVTLSVTATAGLSGGTVTVLENGVWVPVAGEWAWSSTESKFIFTGSRSVTADGTYNFRVTNGAEVFKSESQTVNKVDRVDPVFSIDYDNLIGSWIARPLTFTVLPDSSVNVRSGVTYWYAIAGEGELQWNPIDGGTLKLIARAGDNTYMFKAVSGTGRETPLLRPYNVKYDNKPPTLSVTGNLGASDGFVGSFNLKIAAAAGLSNAVFSVILPNGKTSPLSLSDTEYPVTSGGTYIFRIVTDAFDIETGAFVSVEVPVVVTQIDTVKPAFTINATGTGTQSKHLWINGSAEFEFIFVNGEFAVSGIDKYQYRKSTDDGDTWSGWLTVPSGLAPWVLSGSASNGLYQFRAVSKSGNTSDDSGIYRVSIDTGKPKIEILNENDLNGLTNDDITISIKVTYSLSWGSFSAAGGGTLSRNAGKSVAGVYDVYDYIVKKNGTYEFLAVGNNGERDELSLEVENVDKEKPAFTVNAPEAGTAGTYRWVTGNVEFTFAFLNPESVLSGIVYKYSKSTDDGKTWSGYAEVPLAGNSWILSGSAANGLYKFMAVSDVGNESLESVTYRVSIDTGKPKIELYDELNGNVLEKLTNESITIYLKVTYSLSGGRLEPVNGVTPTRKPELSTAEYDVYEYLIPASGTYTFLAAGGNGNTDELVLRVSNIETARPAFTITPYNTGTSDTYNWVTGNVRFDFDFTNPDSVKSGITAYKYKKSTDGGVTWSSEWLDVPLAGNSWALSGSAANGLYKFIAVSGVGNESLESGIYRVSIDTGKPKIEILNESVLNDLTKDDITISIKVTYSLSWGSFSAAGGGTLSRNDGMSVAGVYDVYDYIVRKNGTYEFAAVGNNNERDELSREVDNIDKEKPAFTVSAPEAGTTGTYRWVTGDVKFTFTFANEETSSGIDKYEYRKRSDENSAWGAWSAVPSGTAPWVLSGSAANGLYEFRAISKSGNISDSSEAFRISIDPGKPGIELFDEQNKDALTKVTNGDITVFIKVTYSASGGSLGVIGGGVLSKNTELSTAEYDVYEYLITASGTYSFRATGGNGRYDDLELPVTNIVKKAPDIEGSARGSEYSQLSGKSFSDNVMVRIQSSLNIVDIKVTNANGKEVKVDFVSGVATFTANGVYTVTAIDAAGNMTEAVFTIDRPNYSLIVVIGLVGIALLAIISLLLLTNTRNKKALRRLTIKTTDSDDPNKFIMFKKIK